MLCILSCEGSFDDKLNAVKLLDDVVMVLWVGMYHPISEGIVDIRVTRGEALGFSRPNCDLKAICIYPIHISSYY